MQAPADQFDAYRHACRFEPGRGVVLVQAIDASGPFSHAEIPIDSPTLLFGGDSRCDIRVDGPGVRSKQFFIQTLFGQLFCIALPGAPPISASPQGEIEALWMRPERVIDVGTHRLVHRTVDVDGGGLATVGGGADAVPSGEWDSRVTLRLEIEMSGRPGPPVGVDLRWRIALIGSHPCCPIALQSRTVEPVHAAIIVTGDVAWLIDFTRDNGGEPPRPPRAFRAGDRFEIGKFSLSVRSVPAELGLPLKFVSKWSSRLGRTEEGSTPELGGPVTETGPGEADRPRGGSGTPPVAVETVVSRMAEMHEKVMADSQARTAEMLSKMAAMNHELVTAFCRELADLRSANERLSRRLDRPAGSIDLVDSRGGASGDAARIEGGEPDPLAIEDSHGPSTAAGEVNNDPPTAEAVTPVGSSHAAPPAGNDFPSPGHEIDDGDRADPHRDAASAERHHDLTENIDRLGRRRSRFGRRLGR